MKILEALEKPPVIIAGVCYIIGLFIVSIHLNQLGIGVPVSLFRIQYLSAGLWALLPLSVVWIFWLLIDLFIMVAHPEKGSILRSILLPNFFNTAVLPEDFTDSKSIFAVELVPTVIAFVLLPLALFLLPSRHNDTSPWRLVIFAALILVFVLWKMLVLISSLESRPIRIPLLMFGFSIYSVLLVMYLYAFVPAYKTIPAYIGGGGTVNVVLALKPDKAIVEQVKTWGIGIKPDGTTDECRLLFSTENEYILIIGEKPHERGIIIRRDLVNALLYQSVNPILVH